MKRHTITYNFLATQSLSASVKRGSHTQSILDRHATIIDFVSFHFIVFARALDAVFILLGMVSQAFQTVFNIARASITLFFALTVSIPLLLLRFAGRVLWDRLGHLAEDMSDSWEVKKFRLPHFVLPHFQLPRFQLSRFSLNAGWQFHAASFIAIAFFLTSPFVVLGSFDSLYESQDTTMRYGKTGFNHFSAATTAIASNNIADAKAEFTQSIENFAQAKSSLQAAGGSMLAIARFVPVYGKKLKDAEVLLEVGSQLATVGIQSAQTLEIVLASDAFDIDHIEATLSYANDAVKNISDTLESVSLKIATVDPDSLPQEYRDDFRKAKEMSAQVLSSVDTLKEVLGISKYVLGVSSDRRYLVVMQNDRELRATGGFMGSFALLDVKKGTVKNLEIPGGGTYDVKGQLHAVLAAPWPLRIINPRWEFQDANWYPDFPASAQKMMWFYENAGGPTVDGVIAINASVAERVLDIIGPIQHSSSGEPITAENFIDITQMETELTYDRKKNKPKEFLGSFIETVQQTIESNPENYTGKLLTLLIDSLLTKDVQLYFRDEASQHVLQSLRLDSSIPQTTGDYLFIVDTNIGGGKTDGVIESDASYLVSADESGSLTASLTITRTHRGEQGDFFTGRKNVDLVRIYVPYGSELLSAAGFAPPPRTEFENPPENAEQDADLEKNEAQMRVDEVSGTAMYDSFGKTVFSNWLQTPVGETTRATITYRLPFRLPFSEKQAHVPYNLLLDRQSGSRIASFSFEARFPKSGTIEFSAPGGTVLPDGRVRYTLTPFLASTPIGLLYSKK